MPMLAEPRKNYFPVRGLHTFVQRPKPFAYATLRKFWHEGINGVVLRTWKIGGTRVTTPEAVEEFLQSQGCGNVPQD